MSIQDCHNKRAESFHGHFWDGTPDWWGETLPSASDTRSAQTINTSVNSSLMLKVHFVFSTSVWKRCPFQTWGRLQLYTLVKSQMYQQCLSSSRWKPAPATELSVLVTNAWIYSGNSPPSHGHPKFLQPFSEEDWRQFNAFSYLFPYQKWF